MKIIVFSNLAEDIYRKSFDVNKIEDINYSNKYIELIKSNFINSRFDFNLLENKGFEVEEIYTNNKNYIKYLCLKKNIRPSNDYFKNIIDFLKTYKPNFIIYRDIDVLNIKQIEQINLNSKFKSISILLSGFPPRNNNYYRLFSHVIFRNPCMQDSLKKYCNSSSLIYHCFNSNILKNLFLKNFDERDKFLSFDGSSYSDGYYKHKKRYFYLNYLLKKKSISCHIHEKNNFYHYLTYVNYYIYKKSKSMIKIIKLMYTIIDKLIYLTFRKKLKRIKIILNEIENFNDEKNINFYGGPLKLIFQNSIKKPIFGIDYYKSINNSKNSLNIHTEGCGDCSGNIRLFEITGLRSCMISEKFQNMQHLFEDGKEYVSYNSIEELEEKINFLRNNPREAQIIAKNGFVKTMNYHTDKTRSEEYIDTLKKLLI